MSRALTRLALLAPALVLLGACEGAPPPAPPAPPEESAALAVDLVAVAKALGRDEAMERQLGQARDRLNAQLQEITADLQDQLAAEQERLEEAGEADAEARLEALTLEANRQLRQQQQVAQQRAAAYRQQLLQAFREDVRGVAREIAREQGARLVVTTEQGLLWFDPAVDITDEVIAAMRARGLEGPEPEAAAEAPAEGEASALDAEVRELEALMDELSSEREGLEAGDEAP